MTCPCTMLRCFRTLVLSLAVAAAQSAVNGVEVAGPMNASDAPVWFLDFAAEMRATVGALRAVVETLSESVITPAVAVRVSKCSRSTVVFAYIPWRSASYTTCSAFPVPAEVLRASAAASTASASPASSFFLSSAHCFMENTSSVVVDKVYIHYGGEHACSLLAHFVRTPPADSYDLALIECPTIAVPPSRISTKPYDLQTPAVMIGYSLGTHIDASLTFRKTDTINGTTTTKTYAPHTKFTRLTDSIQLPPPVVDSAISTVSASRGFTEDGLSSLSYVAAAASAGGFVDHSPPGGMSGGAVMDTACGVFGVTERRSTHGNGGQFVRLTPDVILLLAAAIPAAR